MVLQEQTAITSAGLPLTELAAEVGMRTFSQEVLEPGSVYELARALQNHRESIRGIVSRAFSINNVTNIQRSEDNGIVSSVDRGFVDGKPVILKHHFGRGEEGQYRTLIEASTAEYLRIMGVLGACLCFTLAVGDDGNIFQVQEDLSTEGTFLDEWTAFTDYEEKHHDVKTPLAINDFFKIAFSLAETIDKAAAVGVFHGDLKATQVAAANESYPGIVYPRREVSTFKNSGTVTKLTDWDASNVVHEELNLPERRMSLTYLAPELLLDRNKKTTQVSEVFSFAVLAFRLLTNSLPHVPDGAEGYPPDILKERHLLPFAKTGFLSNLTLLKDIPALNYDLASRIFQTALNPNPNLRFQSCREFIYELSRAKRG